VIYWDYEYFRDQLDYFVQSSHNFSSYSLLMSAKTWEELDAETAKSSSPRHAK
jgi:TRAP-type C4-dicarboxylate transport system substrate-binding protein